MATLKIWDAIVLGAGPAGAIAAHVLASRGRDVLLIDKQNFPRAKVCGCCLNVSALKTLAACGLGELPAQLGARPLQELRVFIDGSEHTLPLIGNVSLSREAFDAALVQSAIEAGATFLNETAISSLRSLSFLPNARQIQLRTPDGIIEAQARVVLAATGLNSTYLDEEIPTHVAPDSHMGVGATFVEDSDFFTPGTVFMSCCAEGYVGLVRLEDNRLNVAAALDAAFLREFSTPGEAVANVLKRAGVPATIALHSARWHGTPLLTRRREHVSAQRILVIGDAAGYVEPFTGEGMAWAMRSGMLAAELICEQRDGVEDAWERLHEENIQSQQKSCKLVARLLRTPRLSAAALGLLENFPALTRLFM